MISYILRQLFVLMIEEIGIIKMMLITIVSLVQSYDAKFLGIYPHLHPTPLQLEEDLEQLKVLENGYKMKVTHHQDGNHAFFFISIDQKCLFLSLQNGVFQC
jgi:hypothetical protein